MKPSKAQNSTSMANGRGRITAMTLLVKRAAQSTAKVTSSRWPASMLANSRTARVNGRTRSVDRNSMGTTRMSSDLGTPGGISTDLM